MDIITPGSSDEKNDTLTKNEDGSTTENQPGDEDVLKEESLLDETTDLSFTEESIHLAEDTLEIGSSVDPDQDVLIALAKSETDEIKDENYDDNVGANLDIFDTVESKQQEVDTLTEITSVSESCDDIKEEDVCVDFNEDEKDESVASEIIFNENLLNESELSEKQFVNEIIIQPSLSSTQETGIFITEVEKPTEANNNEMPEKREEEVVSPSLQRANLRFRWGKTIPVDAKEIVFFSSHRREEPLKLTWSDGGDCFYSKDMEVPTGIYKGTLVIDQKSYLIEDVTIKHYTFEADLYIKEDIVEDNFNAGREPKREDVDSYPDLNRSGGDAKGLNYSEKIEDIIRQQMTSADPEQAGSRSDHGSHGSGRHTPIGDVGIDTYQDGLNSSYSKNFNTSVVEDELEQSYNASQHSSKPQTPQPTVEEIIENTLRGSLSQDRTTPLQNPIDDYFSSNGRKTPVDNILNGEGREDGIGYKSPASSHSLHSSARQTPQKDYISDILGNENQRQVGGSVHSYDPRTTPIKSAEGSRQGSARQTPMDDMLDQMKSPRGSNVGSPRQTPQSRSAHSSARQTPQSLSGSAHGSQEKMNGSHGSLPGHGGSRPQSLTSEQELTQYFEQSSKRVSDTASVGSNKTPTPQYTATTQNVGSRTHSSSSLPVITTQQRLEAEKRSMTPDNYIRIPGDVTAPLVRASSLTRVDTPASRASSRTITPANDVEKPYMESAVQKRIEDLEDTVRNLRKLLAAREQEVHDLTDQINDVKDINRTLQKEVEHCREKHAGSPNIGNYKELEKQYSALSNEKDVLAQEVIKLHDHITELQRQVDESEKHPRLSSYDPNNPSALQRKIDDLQGHVQDLQEANESAHSELNKAERKIADLMKQKEGLNTSQNINQQDLQAENRRLHDQISKLWEQGYGDNDHKARVENQQLRDDNRAIRERNYKLHEENLKLMEELSDLRRVLERQAPSTEPKISRITAGNLERDNYDSKYASLDRSKLPNITAEKLNKTPLHVVNGHVEQKTPEKEGHRYSYRQNKDDKMYSVSSDRDLISTYSLPVDSHSLYTTSMEKSDSYLRGKLDKDSYKSSYDRDARSFRDTDTQDSRFRSSLERAEARLRSSLEKNSYLDRISRYDTKNSDSQSLERSTTPDRLKPDTYRSMPDGISDKDERAKSPASQRYDLTPERLHRHKIESEKRLDYGLESRSFTNVDRDYKSLTASYPELARIPNTTSADKTRELSQSEVDLREKKGRSRSRERHASDCPHRTRKSSPHCGPPPSDQPGGFRFRNITKKRMPPKPAYSWDGRFACAQCGSHLVKHSLGLARSDLYKRDNDTSRYISTRPRSPGHMTYGTNSYYNRDYDYYSTDKKYSAYQSDGYESDTATDILVAATPYEQRISPTSSPDESPERRSVPKYHRRSYSQRRDSLGSDGSSLEDAEESYNRQKLHSRSKSADGRELLRRTEPLGGSGRTPQKTERLSLTTGDPGFRTVTPNVLHTQHNRLTDRGPLTTLTTGMRPFAPRTPSDINLEDVVKFSRQGGKLSQGKVKFVGHLPGRSDIYLGVELDKEDGKHDGTFESVRYYQCKPNKGVFVAFNKVVMAWAPSV